MIDAIIVILIPVAVAAVCAIYLVLGIDYMNKNHPDYKGDDFL